MHHLLPRWQPWSGRLLTLAVFLLGMWIVWRSLRRKRLDAPHCFRCRYNLTGVVSPTCPECGHDCRHRATLYTPPRRWRWAIVGLLIALALPVYAVQGRVRQFGRSYYLRLYPLYALFPEYKLADRRFAHGIRAVQSRDRRTMTSKSTLRVSIDDRLICTIEGEYLDMGSPEIRNDQPFRLNDLDGNGTLDLIVSTNFGGNGSDSHVRVLSFDVSDRPARLVDVVELRGLPRFIDDDHDGLYEVKFTSHCYRCRWTACAFSPYPIVWLKIRNGRFMLDEARMRQPYPDEVAIESVLNTRRRGDRNDDVDAALRMAFDMIYAGHLEDGLALLDELDPYYHDKRRPEPLRDQVLAELARAPFGEQVLGLNGWTNEQIAELSFPADPP